MDWRRAKSILIFAFLCLNLILAYQLWEDRFSQAASDQETADLEAETRKLLESKTIRVIPEIPKETPKLPIINVSLREEFRNPQVTRLSQPIRFISMLNRSTLREIESKSGLRHFDAYRLDTSYGRKDVFLFHQIYRDLPMFDVTVQLFAENGEITGYKQTYVEVKSGVEAADKSGQRIISAYAAVRSLAENYLPEGAVITDIRLGYHGQLYDSEEQSFVPNWRITLSNREPYYVHGFTGAVETTVQP
jgi:regulatory protein YycI of two-component signal transduction system YycFG